MTEAFLTPAMGQKETPEARRMAASKQYELTILIMNWGADNGQTYRQPSLVKP